jgi:hypothetical protein
MNVETGAIVFTATDESRELSWSIGFINFFN